MLLACPAFNRRQELLSLLEWWQQYPHQNPDRPVVWKQISRDKPYHERDWYLLLSRMQQLLERFLIWEELRQDDLEAYPILLRSYRRRQLSYFFERSHKQAKALVRKRPRADAGLLYLDYALEQGYYDYVASHDRTEYTNLQNVSDQLDHFFIAEKLKQACLAHSRGLANQEAYQIHLLSAIEQELLQRPALLQVPAIRIYHSCYKAVVQAGDELVFRDLRQTIVALEDQFPAQEVRDIYLLAINYCIRALNEGREAFIAEALALYERSLERGHLLEDGHLPESTFNNIVSLALKLGRYEWVGHFITEKAVHLRPTFQASITALSLARLYYTQGNAKAAMQQLAQVETKAPFLYLGVKSLQLKVLYETAAWDALHSLLDSFRVYLQRRPDLGYQREHYQHLISFTRRLLQLRPGDRAERHQLSSDIKKASALREKQWFLDKLK